MHLFNFKGVNGLTNFDANQCHKWAQLLLARQEKFSQTINALKEQDVDLAKKLFTQIISGINGGKQADPGMAGSLLYHMAMVSKMEAETQVLIDELHVDTPAIREKLQDIYKDFESDVKELTKEIAPFNWKFQEIASCRL